MNIGVFLNGSAAWIVSIAPVSRLGSIPQTIMAAIGESHFMA